MSEGRSRRPALPELCVGLAMLGLAAIVAFATSVIPQSAYAKVGPAVYPWAIAAGLAVLGCALTAQALMGGWEHERDITIDRRSLAWLGAGLLLNVVLIDGVAVGETRIIPRFGFIIASSVLFVCTARAFLSRRPLRDAAVALALATVSYVFFDRVLGYRIGSGLIEALL